MAKKSTEASAEAGQQQAVEEAAGQLEQLGWDGPFENVPALFSGESSWRASRRGTQPTELASSTLAGLVSTVEAREAALSAAEEA